MLPDVGEVRVKRGGLVATEKVVLMSMLVSDFLMQILLTNAVPQNS